MEENFRIQFSRNFLQAREYSLYQIQKIVREWQKTQQTHYFLLVPKIETKANKHRKTEGNV